MANVSFYSTTIFAAHYEHPDQIFRKGYARASRMGWFTARIIQRRCPCLEQLLKLAAQLGRIFVPVDGNGVLDSGFQ